MIELATDDDLLDALMRFADLRRHRSRLKTPHRFPASMRRARPAPAPDGPAGSAPAGARP
jgi:hypothetical protein